MISHLPILVVGAGPVGLTAALLLIEAGYPVLVVDRNSGLARDMRASTFHAATLDLLQPLGLADPLISGGSISQAWQFMVHGSKRHAVFDLEALRGETAHPCILLCEQYHLTSLLLERLERSPLFEARFNHEVTAVRCIDGAVEVELASPGGPALWQASWLIAADGGDSTVRRCMGLPFPAGELSKSAISLVTDYPFHDAVDGLLGVNYAWTDTAYYSLVQVRDRWRFSFPPDGQADTPEQIRALLGRLFGAAADYPVLQWNRYAQREHCMDDFRAGRVLFAGDAAHLSVPVGGMGMNSGIHDAFCLAEHLVPVLGGADAARLDRYSRRRRTVAVEEIQRLSARLYRWLSETDEDRREAAWREWQGIAGSRERTRGFLLDWSMIRSLRREREID